MSTSHNKRTLLNSPTKKQMYLTELTKQNLAICYKKKKYIQNTMGEK